MSRGVKPLLLKDFDSEVLSMPGQLLYIKVYEGPKGNEYAKSSYRTLKSARVANGRFEFQLGKLTHLGEPLSGWTTQRLERAYERAMLETDVKRMTFSQVSKLKRTRKVPLKLDEVQVAFLDHDGTEVTYFNTGTHCGVNCVLGCEGPGMETGWDCETFIVLYRKPN